MFHNTCLERKGRKINVFKGLLVYLEHLIRVLILRVLLVTYLTLRPISSRADNYRHGLLPALLAYALSVT